MLRSSAHRIAYGVLPYFCVFKSCSAMLKPSAHSIAYGVLPYLCVFKSFSATSTHACNRFKNNVRISE